MNVVRTTTYKKALKRLAKRGATAADIQVMEDEIARDPARGDLIQGTGGLRKLRFAYANIGKRGGGRTIYYASVRDTVFLLTAYAKTDKADITADEKRLFETLVKELSDEQEE